MMQGREGGATRVDATINNQPAQDNERVAEQEDKEKAVRQEATQQPASEVRQREGAVVIGQRNDNREA